MKNLKLFIPALVMASLLSGCADDQYSMEKRFWQAQKEAEKIFNNPAATPPNELKRVVMIMDRFSTRYPKSNLAIEAQFHIARLFLATKEFSSGRKQLHNIIAKYKDNPLVGSEATFMIGNSYELEDKWESALAQYKRLMSDYGITPRGTSVPIYIAQHYKVKFQPEKMREALKEAIAHYQMMSNRYPNSPYSYNCDNLIAQCYAGLSDWTNLIDTYDMILSKYSRYANKLPFDEILMNKALVYALQLKNDEKAKETLNQLLKDYPKSRSRDAAKKFLDKLSRPQK